MSNQDSQDNAASGPFVGLLVIDMTHVLNGPFGTTILTDLGARVIKIEPPVHGDDTRSFGPFVNNRSTTTSSIAEKRV